MDLGPLRALVTDLNFQAHGLAVTVTTPGGLPVAVTGIWLTPATDHYPLGQEFRRASPTRAMALRVDEVAQVPRGTVIVAPERSGGADQTWKVDSVERLEAAHVRVIVVPSQAAT